MRVEPQQPEAQIAPAKPFRHARYCADGDGVISAENQRRAASFVNVQRETGEMAAGVGYFLKVFRLRIAVMLGLRDDDIQIAQVFNFVAKFNEVLVEVCVSQ